MMAMLVDDIPPYDTIEFEFIPVVNGHRLGPITYSVQAEIVERPRVPRSLLDLVLHRCPVEHVIRYSFTDRDGETYYATNGRLDFKQKVAIDFGQSSGT